MTEDEFKTCIAILQVGTGKTMTPDQRRVWYDCLNDLTAEQFAGAIRAYLREGDDWPSIAKLRRFAGCTPTAAIDVEDRAERAWAAVRSAIGTVGGYRCVSFDDPLINAVVRALGGWPRLCETPIEDLKWAHRDFVRTYRTFWATGVRGEECRELPGLARIENSREGREGFNETTVVPTGLPAPPTGKITGPVAEPRKLPGSVAGFLPHFGEITFAEPKPKPEPVVLRDADCETQRLHEWSRRRD